MTAPKPDLRTPAQKRAQVEDATRSSRYKAAEERIRKIVDAWPALSDEQREKLALILCAGHTHQDGAS
jgi:hypothetical protein